MVRKLALEYLQTIKSKGKLYGYYRRDGLRQKINGDYGSPDFIKDYARIHKTFDLKKSGKSLRDTTAWLIEKYLGSHQFKSLAPRTQKDYRKHLDYIKKKAGKVMWADIKRPDIVDMRDKNDDSARRANYLITMASIIGDLAIERGIRDDNPAQGVKKLKLGKGYRPWLPDELLWFEGASTRLACQTAYYLALYTGQREADVLQMTHNSFRDGLMEVTQDKGGERLWIPMHPILRDYLANVRRKGLYIVHTEAGGKYTVDGFRSIWHRETRELGLGDPKPSVGCTFHGLRKNASTALAEAGCTGKEIMAITGHKTMAMIQHYTRDAQRKLLAQSAMRKWENRA